MAPQPPEASADPRSLCRSLGLDRRLFGTAERPPPPAQRFKIVVLLLAALFSLFANRARRRRLARAVRRRCFRGPRGQARHSGSLPEQRMVPRRAHGRSGAEAAAFGRVAAGASQPAFLLPPRTQLRGRRPFADDKNAAQPLGGRLYLGGRPYGFGSGGIGHRVEVQGLRSLRSRRVGFYDRCPSTTGVVRHRPPPGRAARFAARYDAVAKHALPKRPEVPQNRVAHLPRTPRRPAPRTRRRNPRGQGRPAKAADGAFELPAVPAYRRITLY
mmetsp:Transcript_11508/g.39874  ORF Transcript_11508/g.39874 Transcript_11508/m.39874 type:complete len:272 (-) Transcript_11508:4-819(-)